MSFEKEPIISSTKQNSKQIEKVSQLTAGEFYADWSKTHPGYSNLEFAEAYAVAYMNWYAEIHVANNARQNDLLRRAAELLRPSEPGEEWMWEKKRDQWLKDARMEQK